MELKLKNTCNLLSVIEYIEQFHSPETADMFLTDMVIRYYTENI